MSRVGRKPIPIPEGVRVDIQPDRLIIEGPKGKLEVPYGHGIRFRLENGQLIAERQNDSKQQKMMHGLYRALAANAVKGVTEGYAITLDVVGTGYRFERKGNAIWFYVGYSHPVEVPIPPGIEVEFDPKVRNRIIVRGADKYLVGQYAAMIRSIRPPMTYKAKGIKYADEPWRLKPGKSAVKG